MEHKEMSGRQPAWFTMLLVALYDDVGSHGAQQIVSRLKRNEIRVKPALRTKLTGLLETSICNEQEQVADTVLSSFAEDQWHTTPLLQTLNQFCMTRNWTPVWGDDAATLALGGRTYHLPQGVIKSVAKKQQRKARLAAMALVDFDMILKDSWIE